MNQLKLQGPLLLIVQKVTDSRRKRLAHRLQDGLLLQIQTKVGSTLSVDARLRVMAKAFYRINTSGDIHADATARLVIREIPGHRHPLGVHHRRGVSSKGMPPIRPDGLNRPGGLLSDFPAFPARSTGFRVNAVQGEFARETVFPPKRRPAVPVTSDTVSFID